jgi:hypothetical protein
VFTLDFLRGDGSKGSALALRSTEDLAAKAAAALRLRVKAEAAEPTAMGCHDSDERRDSVGESIDARVTSFRESLFTSSGRVNMAAAGGDVRSGLSLNDWPACGPRCEGDCGRDDGLPGLTAEDCTSRLRELLRVAKSPSGSP